ncbi:MAG TPA: protein kinase, partial [Polyangia bacterium]|nr:protein kinase [Polyangia bacterium]
MKGQPSHGSGSFSTTPPNEGYADELTTPGTMLPSPDAISLVTRSRTYSFVLDLNGMPLELGSGRFAKAYLGEERWNESKTAFRRNVAIKILQKGVSEEDALRFQMEKELLERVQGHPNIITLYASGESDNADFVPAPIRDKVENDFMIIELCD